MGELLPLLFLSLILHNQLLYALFELKIHYYIST